MQLIIALNYGSGFLMIFTQFTTTWIHYGQQVWHAPNFANPNKLVL